MDTALRPDEIVLDACALPLVLRLRPVLDLTDDQFFALCQLNDTLRIERTAAGEILLMPPTGGETGRGNADITMQLGLWTKRDGTGVFFDSSTGFRLPNGATRSPDAAWLPRERYEAIPLAERRAFVPLCPDFVIELRSPSDRLADLQAKMEST